MTEQADILDFNEAHKNRNSNQSVFDRFSVKKIKQLLTLDVVDRWVEQINMPHTKNYEFPSKLETAIIHQQSCYIQPSKKFLKESRANNCNCCGQIIRRKRYNIFTCDMFDVFAGEFGTSIPIYFSIIKLHLIILLLLGCIFGIYFCYISTKYCDELNLHNDEDKKMHDQYCAFMLSAQHFLLFNFNKLQEIHDSSTDQNVYYILGYAAYLLMMLTPMMHEILLKLQQIKYWGFDSLNHIRIPRLTLYIKHIPKKFNEQEIQLYIQSAIQSKHRQLSGNNFIEEIVYIYDTHPIKELNEQRRETYLKVLQIVEQLKKEPKLELKGQLIDLVLQIMKQTRDVQKTLQHGLPFTQKVILKFNSESVTNLVYKYYDKSFFNNLKQQITTIKESAQNYKELKKQKFELQAQLLESQTSSNASSIISQSQSDLQEVVRTQSEIFKNSPMEPNNKLKQSMIKFLTLEGGNEEQEQTIPAEQQIDEQKGLHLQRGFRQDDIFWENIGMNTLKRLFLRLITTLITLLAGLLIMALFEILFVIEQHLKHKDGWVSSVLVIVMTLVTIMLSVLSTILVIFMTKKSKRSTYSLQEKNMITFMSPIQQVCILAFPFIFALSILQEHSALNNVAVILAVSKLAQTRLIAKGLLHIYHLRVVSFNGRVKKTLKTFTPTLYFQKQLNQLLTPPFFPIRSRLLYILFIYSTGMIMLFLNPFIIVWCLVLLNIMYFYDKYSVLNEYQYDKLFTFQLQKYLILTYQIIMIPIYCYMYIVTFTNTSTHIGDNSQIASVHISELWTYLGYGTFLLSFCSFILFRHQIANFWVFTILRYQKPLRNSTIFNEKSYFQSYNEYFDELGIQELNTLLIDTFQNMQYQSK